MNAWDKRDEESAKAYAAFVIYRDLGHNRSLQKASNEHYGKRSASKRQLELWSSRYDWVARVEAYDAHLHAQHEQAIAEQFEKDRAEERTKRQAIVKSLRNMLAKIMTEQHAINMQDPDRPGMTPRDLNALSNAAKTILEQSRAEFNDLPTQRTEHAGDGLTLNVVYGDEHDEPYR